MLDKPVVQKSLTEMNDYDLFWTNQVSAVVESVYQSAEHFVSAYGFNPNKTLKVISSNMKVVPIDIKYSLEMFFNELFKDNDNDPPRTSAM
jgi:hypothetical protein